MQNKIRDLETIYSEFSSMSENCRHELVVSKTVQPEKEILKFGEQHYSHVNALMDRILDYLS